MRRALLVLCAVLVGACTAGPDYQPPAQALPETWPPSVLLSAADREDWQDWWTRFNDPALDALVERALGNNLDILEQWQRLDEARARLGLERAERLPTLSAQAEVLRQRQSGAAFGLSDDLVIGVRNLFGVTAALAYEVDLWGRLARSREAMQARFDGVVFEHDAMRLAIVTELVLTYFDYLSALGGMVGLEQSADTREHALRLMEARYAAGAADPLAVEQARADLAQARARLAPQQQRIATTRTGLAVLVGMSPEAVVGTLDFPDKRLTDLTVPSALPVVLPSELLRRRPDIRAAEAALIASNAAIGVAVAERLPQLNLNGLVGSLAAEQSELFLAPSETWAIGATVALPLLDFGRSRKRVEIAEAERDQAETRYRRTVITAFREVRDALSLHETTEENVRQLRQQFVSAERIRDLTTLRYEGGHAARVELLDAEQRYIERALALGVGFLEHMTSIANLFKVLGGGWHDDALLTAR